MAAETGSPREDAPKESDSPNGTHEKPPATSFWTLTLGSVGIVYGDIGTSPLYAFRESVLAAGGEAAVSEDSVLGILSLIVWALVVVVTLKYVIVLLNADNNGEGGNLSLMALAQRAVRKGRAAVLVIGVVAAALFYGDAMLTPAISVLSAVEGLSLATPAFEPYVLPITVAIILVLFGVQSRGTGRVAAFFGPVTLVWFVVLAVMGIAHIADQPAVLGAVNPAHAVSFISGHPGIALAVLGAVFLSVTGAEALYADLGHFGKRPIRTAWVGLVGPALVLNYLGQGALVLGNPAALENPFYLMAPGWALIPLVLLATLATVIASQAVITGAFSLSRQAMQLGLLPRLAIRHTSETQAGQIFMPRINLLLLVGVVLLVLLFRSSGALSAAYGVAVSGTMVMTALLAFVVIRRVWGWGAAGAAVLVGPLLAIDVVFLFANLLKVHRGGWVPLAIGAVVMLVIFTWRRGSRLLFEKTRRLETPLATLVGLLERKPPPRVPGTAVFLTGDPQSAPTALMHSLKHFKVLHEKNAVLSVEMTDVPRVDPAERVRMEPVGESFLRVIVRYGFMEAPNVPKALAIARKQGWSFEVMTTSFFLSRRTLRPSPNSGMPHWQDKLFIALATQADDASAYFQIPTGRVVEIGTQVVI